MQKLGRHIMLLLPALFSLKCADAPEDTVTPTPISRPTIVSMTSLTNFGPRVILKGVVNPNGLSTICHFEYGLTMAYGQQPAARYTGEGLEPIVLSDTISSLLVDSVYHYRIVAVNSAGRVDGVDQTFRISASTGSSGPTVMIPASSGGVVNPRVGVLMLHLVGLVNPRGQETRCYFEYGPTSSYGNQSPDIPAGTGSDFLEVSVDLTGFESGKTYHVRMVGYSLGGYSITKDTTVYIYTPPRLEVSAPTGVGLPSATLHAMVTPGDRPISCRFEYGPTTSYGSSTPDVFIPPGSSPLEVTGNTIPLERGKTYHWRLHCSNNDFQISTADSVFTTPSYPPLEFDYPLSPGTRWKYRYFHLYSYGGSINYAITRGSQIWEVAQANLPNTILITVSRIDTLTTSVHFEPPTITVTQSQASFLVSIDADNLIIRWPEIMHYAEDTVGVVPRYVESLSDTISIRPRSIPNTGIAAAKYLSGIGLVRWEYSWSTNYSFVEYLILDSLSVR